VTWATRGRWQIYARNLEIKDDLLQACVEAVKGSARRICVNIERFKREAVRAGRGSIDLEFWSDRSFDDGQPPKRRL